MTVLILVDDVNRVGRFNLALRAIDSTALVICWQSARHMLQEVDAYLPQARLISLDHDLNPVAGGIEDPGDGLEVAKYLAERKPPARSSFTPAMASGRG